MQFPNEIDALLAVNTLNDREIAGNHFTAKIENKIKNIERSSQRSEIRRESNVSDKLMISSAASSRKNSSDSRHGRSGDISDSRKSSDQAYRRSRSPSYSAFKSNKNEKSSDADRKRVKSTNDVYFKKF